MVIFVLIASLDAKLTLAARARAAEHARARDIARPRRVQQCVERLANLPLLARLASTVLLAAVPAFSDHWLVMLNRWFGWLSSSEPVTGSAESLSSQVVVGVEEWTDEEQLFGSIMVPHVSTR